MTKERFISLTPQMYAEVKRMAALEERRRIIKLLKVFVPTSGKKITILNLDGDLGLAQDIYFLPLDKVFKNGDS
jgi:hypothetical protein